ncbi:SLC5/6 family protein [Flavilitoribacter nigricans]|uniref:Sodium:solute symporter n=1 Tax=Flavilitoribacter nigricans (strain ATCC 23147 / DSM 23189 / NBRC 102662 / NCIMB 1420 / SS-2) TaxID=1122177 RepID=A0A2D0NDS0_FLAN2|nr:sodium:solute symporter [Flavilitoribacter nigricans]PHN06520.1 sodium:solute symporter [Flavilitoribacter nigricans DSM 23189 = NBRC 102662]
MDNVILWQWILVIGSSLIFFLLSPLARSTRDFFQARHRGKSPNTLVLTGSLIISWIFAKSITNAANLGQSFGLVGGLAYAAYYLSFAVAGVILVRLRRAGFASIHQFLNTRYGRGAIILFSLLIGIRLFNEIWSNTMVIGTYFGAVGSASYYWAIVVFTLLTVAYSLKGGLSSSIFTDVIQMVLFGLLLIALLVNLSGSDQLTARTVWESGQWEMGLGLNLLFAALLQSLSYPFHDPVMTDRAFISDERTTLRSFMLAAGFGGLFILLFSFIGIYARQAGMEGDAAVQVARSLGVIMMLLMNYIMVTSAASTLDSSFASFAKLFAIDLGIGRSVRMGRLFMVVLAVLGTIPVFLNPEILSATTVSGTMVIGLTPIFLFWRVPAPRLSFYLSVLAGLAVGILLVLGWYPSEIILSEGKYADLLWLNVWGVLLCVLLFFIPKWLMQKS